MSNVISATIKNPAVPQILYEDNHVVAVFKPFGMLTQGDATGDESLFDWVKTYLKEKYHKPGNVFLGLVHRLDRPVAGIVVFGKTSKGASRLSEQIRNHTVCKTYYAVVDGSWTVKKEQAMVQYLRKDPATNKVAVFDRPEPDAQRAELAISTIAVVKNTTLMEVALRTGRSHQIRAQLAHAGHPIVGDSKYGSEQRFFDRSLALLAVKFSFIGVVDRLPYEISIENFKPILNFFY
jgi:23S rRNA pseudouridine1911/1915/1917 synthase